MKADDLIQVPPMTREEIAALAEAAEIAGKPVFTIPAGLPEIAAKLHAALEGEADQESSGVGEADNLLRDLVKALDTAEQLAAGGEEQEANVNRVLTAAAQRAKDYLKRAGRQRAINRAAEQVAADKTGFIRRAATPPAPPVEAGDDREQLTMIALALRNHGIENCTPEEGVERLIRESYLRRIVVKPGGAR